MGSRGRRLGPALRLAAVLVPRRQPMRHPLRRGRKQVEAALTLLPWVRKLLTKRTVKTYLRRTTIRQTVDQLREGGGKLTPGEARPTPRSRVWPRTRHLLRLAAYHEAAHAVVARTLGCTVGFVDITAVTDGGGQCVHATPDSYRVPGSRRIRGTPIRRETTQQERAAMALRQRDASTATAALAGVALEDIARAVPALDLLPAAETRQGTAHEGLRLRSRSDIHTAAEAARRQHRTDAGRDQFFGRARARAARIVLENWPALTAVADALLEHRTLDGQQVDRLMQAAMGRRSGRSA
jgi:hypothetical protein